MVDNAYQVGLDWDAYRVSPHPIGQVQTQHIQKPFPLSTKIILVMVSMISVILFSYYVMINIPYFDIDEVVYHNVTFEELPPSIEQSYQAHIIGTSRFLFPEKKIMNILEGHPLIDSITVAREKGHIDVFLSIAKPSMIIQDGSGSFFAVVHSQYQRIDELDATYYESTVPTITLDESSVDQMLMIDMLLHDLSSVEEFSKESIIEPLSLHLPSYDATIILFEPISLSRLHSVLQLISLEYKKNQLTNIALNSKVRYDLYQEALFKEHIFGGNN